MPRTFALLAALFLAAPVAFADEPAPEEKKADEPKAGKKARIDKGKLFETMDADADGSVTKEEFKKGMEAMTAKMKERAGDKLKGGALMEKLAGSLGEKLFDKLDADADGKLSKEEFEKAEFDPAKLREVIGKRKDK